MKKNSIPGRKINPVLANMNQMQRDNILIRASQKANTILTLIVLYDKFDFEVEDLEKFINEFAEQLDSYNRGYINVKDFEGILKDECGIEVKL